MEQQKIKDEKDKVKKILLEKERKKQIQKDALTELIEDGLIATQFSSLDGKREAIPQDVMDKVWNRDMGRCVQCGSQENLEFDHIIPFSKGGATTYRNLQILCKSCNINKSNKIG
ncbi:MAG: HNH endonuclease [Ferruginibacter sp.]